MSLPSRNALDTQQSWESFKAWLLSVWDGVQNLDMYLQGGEAWAPLTAYTATPVRQWVVESGQAYIAISNHTSTAVFANDLAAGKWFAADVGQLIVDLAKPTGLAGLGFQQGGVGAVPRTAEDKAREIVSIQDYGAVPDWNGTTGTQNTAFIQAAIDSFGGARGTVNIGRGSYRCDDQRIDIKRCSIVGESPIPNSGGGGSELYFGSLGGLYSSIEDNSAPHLKKFRVTSTVAEWKTANGQTMIDLTGLNYPVMEDVTITGGDIPLQIQAGVTIETHYGNFRNVNINKGFNGIKVNEGSRSQSHSFFGGRIWDCVTAYSNEDSGTSDISFYGTSFESEQAISHGASATAAQTKWFGCRNESSSLPSVLAGQFTQVGTYWSGNRLPSTINVDTPGAGGFLKETAASSFVVAANNYSGNIGKNILPNPGFEFDPSALDTAGVVPGWIPFGATHYSQGKAHEGNYIRLERQAASGTIGITSRAFSLQKGRYRIGFGFNKDGYGSSGSPRIDLMVAGVSAGAAGTYFDVTAPILNQSTEYALEVDVLQDIPQFQFRCQIDASTNGRYFYIYSPYMSKGKRSFLHTASAPPNIHTYGSSMPTTGYRTIGDVHTNLATSVLGAASSQYIIAGWSRITTGSAHVLGTDWAEMRTLTGT